MDLKERKFKDTLREALLLIQERRLKALGNPYATLARDPDYQALLEDTNLIYEHLERMGVIK